MQTALTIAGSDPTGGAGLQIDLQVFRSHGVHGAAVITALTIQDSVKVHRVLPVFPSLVLDQIRVLLADFRPAAIKIGMLASDDVVRNVMLALGTLPDSLPRVIDPILFASDGSPLLERRAWATLKDLLRGCRLVTPNLDEAERLSGEDCRSRPGSERAARYFLEELGSQAVLIKGGHREGRPDDLLAQHAGGELLLQWLEGERIVGPSVHGTGCALSAAITAGLALGQPLEQAVLAARRFIADAIRAAEPIGAGAHFLGLPVRAR